MPLSTGVKALDDLMCGGVPLGVPSLLYGIPNLGKTWLCFQLACMCTRDPKNGGLGKPVLYLDTESFFTEDVFNMYYSYFKKRWPDLPDKANIDLVRVPSIFEFGKMFGIQISIKQSESKVSVSTKFPTDRQSKLAGNKGEDVKETVQSGDWLKSSEVWKGFEKKGYGLLIIDSLTIPIKSVIPSETQNFPARSSILGQLLGTMYEIAHEFNSAILITDHITRNPMSPGYVYGVGEAWGGQIVTYYVKNQFGLYHALKDQREKAGLDGNRLRRVDRHRMPGKEQQIITVMLAHDKGYTDAPVGTSMPAEVAE